MKIAFLTYNRDPSIPTIDTDGCPVTVRHYALELGKLGYKIDIYANKVSSVLESSNYIKKKFKEQKKNILNLSNNVKVIRTPVNQSLSIKTNSLNQETADVPEIIESIINIDFYKDKKLFLYDAVFLFHPLSSFGPVFLGLTPVRKTVLFPMLLSNEYKKYQPVSNIYQELETLALKSVRYVFSSSKNEKELLKKKGVKSQNIKVIHRGFDRKIFSHEQKRIVFNKKNPLKIICVGSIKPQKQQIELVEIAKILKNKGFDPLVTIVGDNQNFIKEEYRLYYKSIISKIKQEKLKDNFIFTGSITPIEITELFRINDLAIFPSIAESFGKAALEAICSGIPTILNDNVPAYKDFAKHNHNAVFYKSANKSCVNIIKELSINSILYMKLSRNGLATAKKFEWFKVTKDLEKQLLKI